MKISKLLFATATVASLLTACGTKNASVDSEIESRVEALLGKMTLEEKLGQMNQLSPWNPDELAKWRWKSRVWVFLCWCLAM